MYDYYRVRFKKIAPPRHRRSALGSGTPRVQMPRCLGVVHALSGLLAGVGIVAACIMGRAPLGSGPVWIAIPVIALPITVTLLLGFNEEQRWTRPLMMVLLLGASVALWCFQLRRESGAMFAFCTLATAYLYGSKGSREYYSYLAKTVDHLKAADFGLTMVPVYAATVGLVVGALLAYALVALYRGYASGFAIDDLVGLIGAMVLLGSGGAKLGDLVGRDLVTRWSRAA